MVSELIITVLILRILVFILGGIIAAIALRGYKRSKNRSMLYLAIGIAFITVGSFIEATFFEFTLEKTNPAHAYEGSLVVLGFLIIIYAIKKA